MRCCWCQVGTCCVVSSQERLRTRASRRPSSISCKVPLEILAEGRCSGTYLREFGGAASGSFGWECRAASPPGPAEAADPIRSPRVLACRCSYVRRRSLGALRACQQLRKKSGGCRRPASVCLPGCPDARAMQSWLRDREPSAERPLVHGQYGSLDEAAGRPSGASGFLPLRGAVAQVPNAAHELKVRRAARFAVRWSQGSVWCQQSAALPVDRPRRHRGLVDKKGRAMSRPEGSSFRRCARGGPSPRGVRADHTGVRGL